MTCEPAPYKIVQLTRPDLRLHCFHGLEAMAAWAVKTGQGPRTGALIAANAEKLVSLYRTPALFADCKAPVFYPDGMGAVMIGGSGTTRLPGVELWLRVLALAASEGLKVSIYGASPAVAKQAHDVLRGEYPKLDLALFDGFQSEASYRADILQRRPDIVFVAQGSPRQEQLIGRLQEVHENALYMGLGGSLDILTGRKRRAPIFYRHLGLEFAHRLLKEPHRIFRQRALVTFLWLHLSGKFGAGPIQNARRNEETVVRAK